MNDLSARLFRRWHEPTFSEKPADPAYALVGVMLTFVGADVAKDVTLYPILRGNKVVVQGDWAPAELKGQVLVRVASLWGDGSVDRIDLADEGQEIVFGTESFTFEAACDFEGQGMTPRFTAPNVPKLKIIESNTLLRGIESNTLMDIEAPTRPAAGPSKSVGRTGFVAYETFGSGINNPEASITMSEGLFRQMVGRWAQMAYPGMAVADIFGEIRAFGRDQDDAALGERMVEMARAGLSSVCPETLAALQAKAPLYTFTPKDFEPRRILPTHRVLCPTCASTGERYDEAGGSPKVCPDCHGYGWVEAAVGLAMVQDLRAELGDLHDAVNAAHQSHAAEMLDASRSALVRLCRELDLPIHEDPRTGIRDAIRQMREQSHEEQEVPAEMVPPVPCPDYNEEFCETCGSVQCGKTCQSLQAAFDLTAAAPCHNKDCDHGVLSPSHPLAVSEGRADLLAEIDDVLMSSPFWRGGRLDTIKWLADQLYWTLGALQRRKDDQVPPGQVMAIIAARDALIKKMELVHPDDLADGLRNKITDLLLACGSLSPPRRR
jgi:hypothetical protein